nr:hypothetical protein [Sicyoidochytrium minutum DNA virus]
MIVRPSLDRFVATGFEA